MPKENPKKKGKSLKNDPHSLTRQCKPSGVFSIPNDRIVIGKKKKNVQN